MNEFFYNQELYDDIKSDENLVICAGLGTGKSQSVLQYINDTKKEKILLIANEKQAQTSYKEGLPERIILHNTVDKSDYVVKDFKQAVSEIDEEKNVLCITKSKFNRLLITRPKSLMMFDKIIIDENNSLNPISLDEVNQDVEKVLICIQPFMSIKETQYFENMVSIVSFLRDIKIKYEREDSVLFYQEKVSKEMQVMAQSMLNNIRRLYDNEKIYGIKYIEILFNILNDVLSDIIYHELAHFITDAGDDEWEFQMFCKLNNIPMNQEGSE
jgi:hypothetical protein